MKIDKSWYIKPEGKDIPSHKSAGGVVVRKKRGKMFILFIRDKKYKECMLPKGRAEAGEPLINTAKREIAEEAGLSDLQLKWKLGTRERLTFEKNEWRKTTYFLFTTNQAGGKQKLQKGEEDYVAEWYDIQSLPSIFWPEQEQLVRKNIERIKKLFLF